MTTYRKRLFYLLVVAVLAGLLIYLTVGLALATGPEEENIKATTDIESLIDQMTLDEKVTFLYGARDTEGVCKGTAGFIPGVERLGIPDLCLSDGPAGVRGNFQATALPAPVALASTFDLDLAYQYGQVIGSEGRAYNQDVLLSPMVNIVRIPYGGRNFETFGEDPFLASNLVNGEVRGLQDEGLIATIKHYVANNQENERRNLNAIVDEKTLHEIYLPGFEAAIDAGAGAVMCAYNAVNGEYSCENDELLTAILRDEWGFTGWVMTDWAASHPSGVDALVAGLDQEMPSAVAFGDVLTTAVGNGTIDETYVDQAVRRILTSMDAVGLLDGADENRPDINDIKDDNAEIAKKIALAGAVLLRNENDVLPLDRSEFTSASDLVIVGSAATQPRFGGGGSSAVRAFYETNLLDALDERSIPHTYMVGIDPDGVLVPSDAYISFTQSVSNFNTIAYTETNALPSLTTAGANYTWAGTINIPEDGLYRFHANLLSGSTVGSLSIDDTEVLYIDAGRNFLSGGGPVYTTGEIELTAGEHTFTLTLETFILYWNGIPIPIPTGEMGFWLGWTTPTKRAEDKAAVAAAVSSAKNAVVFGQAAGNEGSDRELILPDGQDALIENVLANNDRSIVVLNIPSTILMPWAEDAGAILTIWLPGQEGGNATASLLLGEENPSGKLPMTFPVAEADWATYGDAEMYPGVPVSGTTYRYQQEYKEGIYVGYRYFDKEGKEPLFPFGHGLSYTDFEYSNLSLKSDKHGVYVSFTVSNTGSVKGTEVPQVYIGPSGSASAVSATSSPHEKDLVGFDRITLDVGESQDVTIYVKARQLSDWDTNQDCWVVDEGLRPFYIGSSSRDIRLQDNFEVTNITEGSLSLSKQVSTASGGTVNLPANSVVTYTLVLSNGGPGSALGVVLTDVLPVEVSFNNWVQQGSALLPPPPAPLTWGPWDIAAGESYTIAFTAQISDNIAFAGQTVTNTAIYSSSNAGSGSANASFTILKTYQLYLPLVVKSAP